MPIEIAPAKSSAMPPRTTIRLSPRDDRPAARAKGTVRPSERPMTTSRTTSGSMSLLSSSIRSLQHFPSALEVRPHFDASGAGKGEDDAIGQTGGLVGLALAGFGSGTLAMEEVVKR